MSEVKKMVGARGFEPPTSRSRTERSTRLSHAPTTKLCRHSRCAVPPVSNRQRLYFSGARYSTQRMITKPKTNSTLKTNVTISK